MLALIAAIYTLLAAVAVALDTPWSYVADNRFEQFADPAGVLRSTVSVWEPTRGLGAAREDVWLGSTVPAALLRALGLPMVATERIFHVACLVLLGMGTVALLRLFRPRLGGEHVLAGALAMFNPFTASFLVPSNLFLMAAISPWLVVVFVHGVRSAHPWRWAAIFALVTFAAGNSDTPGLVYSAVMIGAVGVALIVTGEVTVWRVASWGVRAGALALLCNAWILVKTSAASDALASRLADTELPSSSALASSWSESIRGLGNWLSYFRENGSLLKPQTAVYFEQPVVVLATFVMPILALLSVWLVTWRGRVAVTTMTIAALVVMVGGFAGPRATPFGSSLLWVLENVDGMASFRNTYKAGTGLAVGIAILVAVGVTECRRSLARTSSARARTASFAVATVALLAALPFASGSVYQPIDRLDAIPAYWDEALDYLDDLEPGGRTLILPATSQTRYWWGYPGDDIFDALLERPHAVATGWMLSTRPAHNALEAISLAGQAPAYRPGVIGDMARRLGITEIVIRNDIDWRNDRTVAPAAFDGLRTDPELELVRTFGDVEDSDADSSQGAVDGTGAELPAVEVYRLRAQAPLVDVRPTSSVILAGDAHAWPQLARAGLLDGDVGVLAAAALDDDDLRAELEGDAVVVISDTARRRVRTLLQHEPQLSPTLADGQVQDRDPRPVYPDRAGAESVAWFRDATRIEGAYIRLGGNRNDRRAALAFDGDPSTAWAVPSIGITGPRAALEVHLRAPTTVSEMRFQSLRTPSGAGAVRSLTVQIDDGDPTLVRLDAVGTGRVSLDPVEASVITIVLTGISGVGQEVGLAEVAIEGLDLVEHVQSPTDLLTRTDGDVDRLLDATPVAYTFRRVARAVTAMSSPLQSSRYDEEVTLRRRFDVVHADRFDLSGSLVTVAATSDDLLERLVDGPLDITTNRSPTSSGSGPSLLAFDGDRDTWWSTDARFGTRLDAEFAAQQVSAVRISIPGDGSTARLRRVTATVGDQKVSGSLTTGPCSQGAPDLCDQFVLLELPRPVRTDRVSLHVDTVDRRGADRFASGLIRIAEVEILEAVGDDASALRIDPSVRLADECVDVGLSIGSFDQPLGSVPVRIDGTVGDLLGGVAVPFAACTPVELGSGPHALRSDAGSPVDEVGLLPVGRPTAPAATDRTLEWHWDGNDRIVGRIDGTDGTVDLATRMSYDPRWELRVDGRRVGAKEIDAGNRWRLETSGVTSFELVYAPAERLGRALAVTAAGCAICLGLALWPRRGRRRRNDGAGLDSAGQGSAVAPTAPPSWRRDVVVLTLALVPAVAFTGPFAIGVWLVTVGLTRLRGGRDTLGLAAPTLVAVGALWSVLIDPGAELGVTYSQVRWGPSTLVQLGIAFLVLQLALIAADHRRGRAT